MELSTKMLKLSQDRSTERRSAQPDEGAWIPLMEYALKTGLSLSTLRRYIKANKIRHKIENGRYLLLDQQAAQPEPANNTELQRAQVELQRAREEIAELKTLIAFYEEKLAPPRFNN